MEVTPSLERGSSGPHPYLNVCYLPNSLRAEEAGGCVALQAVQAVVMLTYSRPLAYYYIVKWSSSGTRLRVTNALGVAGLISPTRAERSATRTGASDGTGDRITERTATD